MAGRSPVRLAWKVVLYVALWTAPGINRIAGSALYRQVTGAPPLARGDWLGELVAWWNCAIVALPVIYLARRLPLSRPHRARNFLVHLPASFAFSLVEIGTNYLLDRALFPGEAEQSFGVYFAARLAFDQVIYWVTVGISLALVYRDRLQEREVRAAQLEARLAQAQMEALRAQLDPHFLFNTLNTISSLVESDPAGAERMIARLSDLLRTSLERAGGQETTLRRELEFTEAYLDIMRIRFGARLETKIDVEPGLLDVMLPSLCLQPLVENAVKHGVAPRPEGGRVEIRASREDASLVVQVHDDGPGLRGDPWSGAGAGLGLANTRERLEQLYGPSHHLDVRNDPRGGVIAQVSVPCPPAGR